MATFEKYFSAIASKVIIFGITLFGPFRYNMWEFCKNITYNTNCLGFIKKIINIPDEEQFSEKIRPSGAPLQYVSKLYGVPFAL